MTGRPQPPPPPPDYNVPPPEVPKAPGYAERPADTGNIAQRRPAEAGTPVVTAIAILIARAFGVDDADTVGYIAIALSFVPMAITWSVNLVRGRRE